MEEQTKGQTFEERATERGIPSMIEYWREKSSVQLNNRLTLVSCYILNTVVAGLTIVVLFLEVFFLTWQFALAIPTCNVHGLDNDVFEPNITCNSSQADHVDISGLFVG